MKSYGLLLIASCWLFLTSCQAAVASPANIIQQVSTGSSRNLTSLSPHALQDRPPQPSTYHIPYASMTLTVDDFNQNFPHDGADIKPAFLRFRQWFDYTLDLHPDLNYPVRTPRTGLRWDSDTARLILYPEARRLTLGKLRYAIVAVEAFMQMNEWMELTFVVRDAEEDILASGAAYFLRPTPSREIVSGINEE